MFASLNCMTEWDILTGRKTSIVERWRVTHVAWRHCPGSGDFFFANDDLKRLQKSGVKR